MKDSANRSAAGDPGALARGAFERLVISRRGVGPSSTKNRRGNAAQRICELTGRLFENRIENSEWPEPQSLLPQSDQVRRLFKRGYRQKSVNTQQSVGKKQTNSLFAGDGLLDRVASL
jgi:hypothetical protein